MPDDEDTDTTPDAVESTESPRVIPAAELFGDAREVWIDFHGECYRLRITRRNKLILQK